MTGEVIDSAVAVIDEHLRAAPVHVSIAWRTLRGAVRRARRVSSTTMPHLMALAQHAVAVRDVLRDVVDGRLDPRADRARAAVDQAEAMVQALSTGRRDEDETPLPSRW